jgi:hypothetical protein
MGQQHTHSIMLSVTPDSSRILMLLVPITTLQQFIVHMLRCMGMKGDGAVPFSSTPVQYCPPPSHPPTPAPAPLTHTQSHPRPLTCVRRLEDRPAMMSASSACTSRATT